MLQRHNKKRNTGLLYEFLTKYAAQCMVEGNEKQARLAIKLIRKHFKKGSQLNREFRLFHALTNTYVEKNSIAKSILESAREACKHYDHDSLDREKSLLIREINHTFKNREFYNQKVETYKLYASIQTLVNEWQKGAYDNISLIAQLENELVENLRTPKVKNILESHRENDSDDLLLSLMLKKIDKKYAGILDTGQTKLINSYVYSLKENDTSILQNAIDELREQTTDALDNYMKEQCDDLHVIRQCNEVKELISREIEDYDDRVLARYLRVAQLKREILEDR